ncbi:RNA-binding protein [Candidatus Woesearchaeota archaeon CG08_land_8_20_14_0_20_47_9]|nr:MAG: RNA-binding protein [Candidatus Woesearchaeota archaeon CG10_big_fil_rev_8_21_14_0_10_47_5]PIO04490.1 MAG: RNA-binding protein [Candidatus Woesearchaeota archaeon CG08_land_8_20_14_0_20_47_9]HII30263.1 YhbY family RNA-binding protein [Candidatus Woesearchaeota archaeon]
MILSSGLVSMAVKLHPTVRIGKSGITQGIISEIDQQLKARQLVKVKLLKSFSADRNKREVLSQLAGRTSSEIVKLNGGVAVFYRDKPKA